MFKHSLYSLLIILCCAFVVIYSHRTNAEELATTTSVTNIREDSELMSAIGEHFIVGFRGPEISSSSKIVQDINTYNLGGVILFDYDNPTKRYGRNIASKHQTKTLISDLKRFSNHPIWVAIDAEGGSVNRFKSFKNDAPSIMPAQDIASRSDYVARAHSQYGKLASFLDDLGFNLNFAPVIDVNVNEKNPIIGFYKRSYSSDPKKVEAMAKIFIEEHRDVNILTSLKHFPGHGSSRTDSHKGFVDVTDTYKRGIELLPWMNLIKDGFADSVMVGHIFNRRVDKKYPASISSAHIKTELQKRLNYKGLIISDDMQMGAITKYYGLEEAIIRAISAGTNIVILSNNIGFYDEDIASKATDTVVQAIEEGKITREIVLASAEKIRKAKQKIISN